MGKPSSSSSCSSSSCSSSSRNINVDLKLGLSYSSASTQRSEKRPNIKTAERKRFLYVKVYMAGVPIGRKLDLLAQESYEALFTALSLMFKTRLLCSQDYVESQRQYMLTYQDEDGDWMMVGDVPWEMFLRSVKRLRITRA